MTHDAPDDPVPAAELHPYAHNVRLGLAARGIRRAARGVAEACRAYRSAVAASAAAVYCGDVDPMPFASVAAAARFAIAVGASPHGERSTYTLIARAADSGAMKFGFRWRRRPDQPAGERRNGARPTPVVEARTGRRYPSINDAAAAHAAASGRPYTTAYNLINRALDHGGPALGTRWERVEPRRPRRRRLERVA